MTAKMYAAAQRRLRLLRATFDTGTFATNPSYIGSNGLTGGSEVLTALTDAGAQFALTRGSVAVPDTAPDAVAIFQKHSSQAAGNGINPVINASMFLYNTSTVANYAHGTTILSEMNIIGGGIEGFGEAGKFIATMQPHATLDNVPLLDVDTPIFGAVKRGQNQAIVAEADAGYAVRETTPGSGVWHMYPAIPQRQFAAELSFVHYTGNPAKTAIPVSGLNEHLFTPLLLGNGLLSSDPTMLAHTVAPFADGNVVSSRIHAFAVVNPFSPVAGNYGFLVPRASNNALANFPVRYAAFASGARTEVGLDFTDAIHSVAGIVLPNNDGMKGISSGTPYRMVWMNSSGNIDLGETGHHINFPGAGQQILGDMANATINSRAPIFKSTSPTTVVTALPGGGGTIAGFESYSTATGVTTTGLQFLSLTGEARLAAVTVGPSAPGNPYMTFYTSFTEQMRIDAAGLVSMFAGAGISLPATTGIRNLLALKSNGTTKVNVGLDGSHFFAIMNAAGSLANFTIDPATGNFVTQGTGAITSTLDVTGITTINNLLNLNTLTTSATLRPIITVKEASNVRYSIGMTSTDLFAIINAAGSTAIVTVDDSGNTTLAGDLTVTGPSSTFSPGITQGGAATTVAANGGHYRVFGKWCFLQIEATMTTPGGAIAGNNAIIITGIPAAIAPKRTGNESYIGTFAWFRTGIGYFHAQAYAASGNQIAGRADAGVIGLTAAPGGGAAMIANDKLMVAAHYEIA